MRARTGGRRSAWTHTHMTKESIRRKLGYKNQSKKPLLQEQVDDVVGQFLSQPTIQGLSNAFRVALAYAATLRWDDYEDMVTFLSLTTLYGSFWWIPRQTHEVWSVGHLCSFDSLEFCLSIVSYASFEALKRTQPRENCSVACYVSWRTS